MRDFKPSLRGVITNISRICETIKSEYVLDIYFMRHEKKVGEPSNMDCGNGARIWYSVALHHKLIHELTGKRRYEKYEDYPNY